MTTKLTNSNITAGAITSTALAGSLNATIVSSALFPPSVSSVVYSNNQTAIDENTSSTLTINGTNFDTSSQVLINNTLCSSITYVSATQLIVTTPSLPAGNYDLLIGNSYSQFCFKPAYIFYSGSPSWVTSSLLGGYSGGATINLTLSATGATTYTMFNSVLPGGLFLLSNGTIYGTLDLVTQSTTLSFTVRASDGENQGVTRTFSMTVSPSFNVTTTAATANDGTYITQTFSSAGTFVVNTGSSLVEIWAWGGGGAGGTAGGWGNGAPGGAGGAAYGIVPLTAGNTYNIVIGGGGGVNPGATGAAGGGGGMLNNSDNQYGSGGGGYSGIFVSSVNQTNALLIAGGGGGGGSSRAGTGNSGGGGGGTTGQQGASPYDGKAAYGGGGGTQSAGGTATGGVSGSALQGGTPGTNSYGGGGGGGYWGGAGGGYSESNTMGGGGGGSGYFNSSLFKTATLYAGVGTTPGNSSDSLRGTSGNAGAVATAGTAGKVILRYTVAYNAIIWITNTNIVTGVGSSFSVQLVAYSEFSPTLTYSLVSGSLPSGVSLAGNGVLSGTPPLISSYPFSVTATDSSGNSSTKAFTLQVQGLFLSPSATPIAYTVPTGVTSVTVHMWGGNGGNSNPGLYSLGVILTTGDLGGKGAYLTGTLAVTPGEVLNIYVGGAGGNATSGSAPGAGGINGGGGGPTGTSVNSYGAGGGGGGWSAIRRGASTWIAVAGGGGGAGHGDGYGNRGYGPSTGGNAGTGATAGAGVAGSEPAGNRGSAAGAGGVLGTVPASGGDGDRTYAQYRPDENSQRGGGGGGGAAGGGGTSGADAGHCCAGAGGGASIIPAGWSSSFARTVTNAPANNGGVILLF